MYFRTDVKATLINSCASDHSVANAARVSVNSGEKKPVSDDRGLISYLMRNRHGSPFEHNMFTWRVEAPIFCMRELMRHRIASYNEQSARFSELAPEVWFPTPDRPIVQAGKATEYTLSTDQALYERTSDAFFEAYVNVFNAYKELLAAGVAREVARAILPVGVYSSAYVTMNARGFMNFLSLRTVDEGATYVGHPLIEMQKLAAAMEEGFKEKMPITHSLFREFGSVAP